MTDINQRISKIQFLGALERLNELLPTKVTLIAGGGGAMILGHHFPLATTDLDAIPKSISVEELDPLVKKIAQEQNLPLDWLNPYFTTFTHTLPSDYGQRLIRVFEKDRLEVFALGREDLLIMKCFAARNKDMAHARALIKAGANLEFVENHLEALKRRSIPGADRALDFLDQLIE
jgi:Nucleotidyltransferase of unknown function (DUF6036)